MTGKNILGIDIGSNSVGSCWIKPDNQKVYMGVSVFPAGVEESDQKRGNPKNQTRRETRSQRKTIARRAISKAKLRKFLQEQHWIPTENSELRVWESTEKYNPWLLRKKGLTEPLQPFEFGKILLHLLNGRGAWWTDILDEEQADEKVTDKEEKELRQKVQTTKEQMVYGLEMKT